MFQASRIAGLVIIWASVAVIALGTYYQEGSPRYQEARRRRIAESAGPGPEEGLNPAGRMVVVLAPDLPEWPFALAFGAFVAAVFTVGVLVLRFLGRRQRDLALMGVGIFALGCFAGGLLGLGVALQGFLLGFGILGLGYLMSSMGLVVGATGLAGEIWLNPMAPKFFTAKGLEEI